MDDIGAVMDAAGVERATVLGISEGAAMGALFAAQYPARVDSLIMYGSFARGEPSDDYPWAMEPGTWDLAIEGFREAWGEGVSMSILAPGEQSDTDLAD